RRTPAGRLRGAGRARGRPARAQGPRGCEEDMGPRDQGGAAPGHRARGRDVQPRDAQAGLPGRPGGRQGRAGAIPARSSDRSRQASNSGREAKGAREMRLRPIAPAWGRIPAIILALVCAIVLPASAQPKSKKADKSEPVAGVSKEDGKAPVAKKEGKP